MDAAGAFNPGLVAEYFANDHLDNAPSVVRADASIDFDWKTSSPDSSAIPDDRFSVRWTGYVVSPYSEDVTFIVQPGTDEGIRFRIDGRILIDSWSHPSDTEFRTTITLTANTKTSIQLEYREAVGEASIRVEWESARIQRTVIPSSSLFSNAEIIDHVLANSEADTILEVNEDQYEFDLASILSQPGNDSIQKLEFVGSGGTLRIDAESIDKVMAENEVIVVHQAKDSVTEFLGDWIVEQREMVDGEPAHVVRNGDRVVVLVNERPLTNPVDPLDVDRSGKVTLLDSLHIVNELPRQSNVLVSTRTKQVSLANHYPDTNGDGKVSAADALRIVNALNLQGSASGEWIDKRRGTGNEIFIETASHPALS